MTLGVFKIRLLRACTSSWIFVFQTLTNAEVLLFDDTMLPRFMLFPTYRPGTESSSMAATNVCLSPFDGTLPERASTHWKELLDKLL
ncbi:hypothetical protein BX666DRAFT_1991138 [Dichotomocladium elegans]|nr:hypothetical protein BX666DRAFT_1991138 [Dichotomocladium elegans]